MHEITKYQPLSALNSARVYRQKARNSDSRRFEFHFSKITGGPPSGSYKPATTTKSPEFHFAVQCLSRFTLASQLASQGVLKRGACMIGAPGGGGKTIDADDLDFKNAKETGKWKPGVFGLMATGARDSAVLDSVTQVSLIELLEGVRQETIKRENC